MGTFLTSETEPQRLFILVPWAAVAHSFALRSFTRLVVRIRVSPSDANRMFALTEVGKSITWYLKWPYRVRNAVFHLSPLQILIRWYALVRSSWVDRLALPSLSNDSNRRQRVTVFDCGVIETSIIDTQPKGSVRLPVGRRYQIIFLVPHHPLMSILSIDS